MIKKMKTADLKVGMFVKLGKSWLHHSFLKPNFLITSDKQIKKIYVSASVQTDLVRGRLAIVKLGEEYELVPAPVADKISQRDEGYVLSQQAATQEVDEDDPYADYQIPDDLMW